MATVIPRSYIENYSNTLNLASEKARESLIAALTQLDYSRPVAEIRDAVISIMQVACGASTDVAARLAADFYDGLRVRMVGESLGAVAESMRNPDATDGAIRAFIQIIVDGGDADAFIDQCASRLDYETRKAANLCTFENAKRDPLKPKWARIPAGDETCEWCIMLASRGFAYSSKQAASHSHANCDCRVVPSWDKDNPAVQGYDPKLYYDMWKHPEKYENKQSNSVNPVNENDQETRFNEYLAATQKRSEIYNRFRQEKDSERKNQLKEELIKADEEIKIARSKLTNGEYMFLSARIYPINEYYKPDTWDKIPNTDEIIQTLGGGDRTTGSCSSLAFAYFGNKGGEVVQDFRGGSSCNFFATNGHIKQVTTIDGVESYTETHRNAFTAASNVLQNAQEGKRYYFTVGKHAAVIEKRDGSFYYLELQSQTDNGWHKLTNVSLKKRFGCTKSSTISGIKLDQDAILIDGDTLSNNAEFLELMGYINTPIDLQMKGVGGGIK